MKYAMTAPNLTSFMVIGALFLLLFILLFSALCYRLEAGPEKLRIRSLVYNTSLDYGQIRLDGIRVMNLHNEDISINIRTNGIGLPGLMVGWFSGTGGKYKLYLTDRTQVLFIPTTENYTVLFSTKQGERIMEEIRENAQAAR